MHAVQYTISAWYQERRALYKPGGKVKYLFPILRGCIHFVRCIPVQEKRMEKKRKEPMSKKE